MDLYSLQIKDEEVIKLTPNELDGLEPIQESIVDSLSEAVTMQECRILFKLISATKFPKDHERVLNAVIEAGARVLSASSCFKLKKEDFPQDMLIEAFEEHLFLMVATGDSEIKLATNIFGLWIDVSENEQGAISLERFFADLVLTSTKLRNEKEYIREIATAGS